MSGAALKRRAEGTRDERFVSGRLSRKNSRRAALGERSTVWIGPPAGSLGPESEATIEWVLAQSGRPAEVPQAQFAAELKFGNEVHKSAAPETYSNSPSGRPSFQAFQSASSLALNALSISEPAKFQTCKPIATADIAIGHNTVNNGLPVFPGSLATGPLGSTIGVWDQDISQCPAAFSDPDLFHSVSNIRSRLDPPSISPKATTAATFLLSGSNR